MFSFLNKSNSNSNEEIKILCNCVENYIEIANLNSNTLDDYFSIIALIKMFEHQYRNYSSHFKPYLDKFKDNGILDEYYKNKKNIAKKVFEKYGTNTKKAREFLFKFVEGTNSRFISYLIMIGLCGPPTTPLARYVLATIYNHNSSLFNKQAIYYTQLYINKKLCKEEFIYDLRGVTLAKKLHILNFYKFLGIAYERNNQLGLALKCLTKANKTINCKKDIERVQKKIINQHQKE